MQTPANKFLKLYKKARAFISYNDLCSKKTFKINDKNLCTVAAAIIKKKI